MTRELRLNNPLGLKQSDDKFQGEVQPSSDDVFKQFITLVEGVRAGAKVLLTYFHTYGLGTVTAIINRWAPWSENNVPAYIDDVAQRMQVSPGDILNLDDPQVLASLVAAMVHHENGQGIDPLIIQQAVNLAYA